MKYLNRLLLVVMFFNTTSASYAVERDVSELQFSTAGWIWIPTSVDGDVESFVGLRTNEIVGENITALWLRRTEGQSWESWAWSDQDQSKAIASVKSILELTDSTDSKWPVAPSIEPVEQPEILTKGVLESDPLSLTVQALPDPELLILSLESVGWKTAWLDIWDFECEDFVVLDIWSIAVEVTDYELDLYGGPNDLIQTTFVNTVSKPCGTDFDIRVIESHGLLTLITESSPGSIIAEGIISSGTGNAIYIERFTMVPGQAMIEGSLINTSNISATVLTNNGVIIEVEPGEEVAVVATWGTCSSQCRRIIGGDQQLPEGQYFPVYTIGSKCYCCCWSNLQPASPAWPTSLPSCPCEVNFDVDGNPVDEDCNPLDNWELDLPADQDYHPGAAFCLRTCATYDGGPGQQCCYDSRGNLITDGAGAGTPDLVSPCNWFLNPWDTWTHRREDVIPFLHCERAGMLDCYLLHRHPNNGDNCDCNPPEHENCNHEVTTYECECE